MKLVSNQEIVCVAEIKAKPEHKEEVLKILVNLIPLSTSEAGCVRYEFHQSLEDACIFVFVDRFKDEAAFAEHCDQEYIKESFDKVLPSLTDYVKILVLKELKVN